MARPTSADWPSIRVAAITPQSAIIEPIERSMPPEITAIACPTVASARGSTAIARPWRPATP